MSSLGDRSTIELMVLALTVTICLALLLTGLAISLSELLNPQVDTSEAVNTLSDILSMILGALLGLLAGRSERATDRLHRRGTGETDGL